MRGILIADMTGINEFMLIKQQQEVVCRVACVTAGPSSEGGEVIGNGSM